MENGLEQIRGMLFLLFPKEQHFARLECDGELLDVEIPACKGGMYLHKDLKMRVKYVGK